MPNSSSIYVSLVDEGTEVWRPVKALKLNGDVFQLAEEQLDENWQFPSGAVVRCENRIFSDGTSGLVAIERV